MWCYVFNYSNKPVSGNVSVASFVLEWFQICWSHSELPGFGLLYFIRISAVLEMFPTSDQHTPTLKFSVIYWAHVADLEMTSWRMWWWSGPGVERLVDFHSNVGKFMKQPLNHYESLSGVLVCDLSFFYFVSNYIKWLVFWWIFYWYLFNALHCKGRP